MDNLIKSYYDWLKNNSVINKIDDYYEENTPFLDMYNDSISLYHKKIDNDMILISDGGFILSELDLLGINVIKKGKRKEQFDRLINSFHVELSDEELIITANKENYPLKKHFLLQCIVRLEDLYLLSKATVKSTFIDDVIDFIDTLGIGYTDDVKLYGKSKLDHNIDLIISGKQTEKIVKFANNLNANTLRTNLFTFEDIKGSRKRKEEFYLLINDENIAPKKEHLIALNQYNIKPLFWSDKNNISEELKRIS